MPLPLRYPEFPIDTLTATVLLWNLHYCGSIGFFVTVFMREFYTILHKKAIAAINLKRWDVDGKKQDATD